MKSDAYFPLPLERFTRGIVITLATMAAVLALWIWDQSHSVETSSLRPWFFLNSTACFAISYGFLVSLRRRDNPLLSLFGYLVDHAFNIPGPYAGFFAFGGFAAAGVATFLRGLGLV